MEYEEFFKTGTVFNTNPSTLTCDIAKTEGGFLYSVPIANTTGGILTNDVSWGANLRGAVVYYTYMDGCPYILGTLPQRMEIQDKVSTNTTETKTGGDNDTAYGSASANSYTSGRETDYQPNDKVISADGGSKIALLSEGGVAIKASPLSQIIMGAGMDFIRMVCRQFEIFTDFGSLCFSHGSSGRTGLTIKGGAAYSDEAQAGTGEHTVYLHMGDTDNNSEMRFGVRVTSTDGAEHGALAMGKNGALFFETSKNYLCNVGQDMATVVDGDTLNEMRGDCIELIGKSHKVDIEKNEELNITKERSIVTGMEERHSVGEDFKIDVGGVLDIGCNGLIIHSAGSAGGAGADLHCSYFNIVKV